MINYLQPIPDRVPGWNYDKAWPISPVGEGPGELGECVEVREFGLLGQNAYCGGVVPMYPSRIPYSKNNLWVRRKVAELLKGANQMLLKDFEGDYRLYVLDAFRPYALQKYMVTDWYPNYLKGKYQDWTEQQIKEETDRIWALPSKDVTCPSPHLTGGAIDLVLYDCDSEKLCHMGSGFDESTPLSDMAYFETVSGLTLEMRKVRDLRRILYNLLTSFGFVNYPHEFWHFSYGDQEWGQAKGVPALFSVMTPSLSSVRR